MCAQLIFKNDPIPITEHPAFLAWSQLRQGNRMPESIEVLTDRQGKRPNRKSVVYRLNAVGIEGAPIIAKRTKRSSVLVERMVYQEILPVVPVSSLHCYGVVDDENDDLSWLFLEQARGVPYDEEIATHRRIAAEWLGITHATTAGMPDLASRLPDEGAYTYLPCLHAGRDTITKYLPNPVLSKDDLLLLETILEHLDIVESHWSMVECLDASMPRCLVHSDFVKKNVRVYNESAKPVLYVMDWDIAGWGAPSVDIERQDLVTYWAFAREVWPQLDLEQIRAMANLGVILRNLGLIQATSGSLAYDWVEHAICDLAIYESHLIHALRVAHWV